MIGKSLSGLDSPPSVTKWKEFATATDVIAKEHSVINNKWLKKIIITFEKDYKSN